MKRNATHPVLVAAVILLFIGALVAAVIASLVGVGGDSPATVSHRGLLGVQETLAVIGLLPAAVLIGAVVDHKRRLSALSLATVVITYVSWAALYAVATHAL